MVFPSFDQAGEAQDLGPKVSCFVVPVARSSIQISVFRVLAFRFWVDTSKSSFDPSGLRARSCTPFSR
ncbi:hypothetical protein GALL_460390 [mine drainage metagenome]|uniref:Uncharacterized protein n=1 Tax=mine drainage metagenome TaxID=410659 RepID=A0A1J5PNF8_9ZZZZ